MAVTPPGGADVMELIEAADRELYAAKPGGRRQRYAVTARRQGARQRSALRIARVEGERLSV